MMHNEGRQWRVVILSLAVVILALVARSVNVSAAEQDQPSLVLIDTDIGNYLDDPFALGLALVSPEVKIVGITTVGGQADDRAWLTCRFITQAGRKDIPVAAGQTPQPPGELDGQIQYRRHPAAIFNRTLKPVGKSAVELMREQVEAHRGEVTIVALGPLTNLARLLTEHPDMKSVIKRIMLLGGSLKPGPDGLPEPEFNLKADVAAAQTVFRSGVPLTVITADTAGTVRLTHKHQKRLFSAYRPLAFQLHNLFELHVPFKSPGHFAPPIDDEPLLFDPVAVAAACGQPFGAWRELAITVDDAGRTIPGSGAANCRVLHDLKAEELTRWMIDRLAADGEVTLPRPAANRSQLVPLGAFPRRVHVCENYDTDIERRWWMSGEAEIHEVPPGGRRCCRAVLTQDFDGQQGDTRTMYRAVIFNPVPGPPMGPNTRLTFRYKITGTSDLRIQLYTLSKGYHRYLSLADLPQDKWSQATVDMTAMRRPDGSGGPLSEEERIDDIQFYVDPRATLLIDDVVLYDAAADDETRPFPRHILFTGWFDTGKQGKEWPGEFEIVPHEAPRTWKYARSLLGPDGPYRLHVSLRGPRQLEPITELTFQYRLSGANSMRVELFHDQKPLRVAAELRDLPSDAWSQARCRFDVPPPNILGEGSTADEIRFHVPSGGVLSIDDLLLYAP